jgi:hypothetical protein
MSDLITEIVDAVKHVIAVRGRNCCCEGIIDMGYLEDKSLDNAQHFMMDFRCSCGKCCWSEGNELPHPECQRFLLALRKVSVEQRTELFKKNWTL